MTQHPINPDAGQRLANAEKILAAVETDIYKAGSPAPTRDQYLRLAIANAVVASAMVAVHDYEDHEEA